jgi:hypothetical protein
MLSASATKKGAPNEGLDGTARKRRSECLRHAAYRAG